jgi:TPR repeat protein
MAICQGCGMDVGRGGVSTEDGRLLCVKCDQKETAAGHPVTVRSEEPRRLLATTKTASMTPREQNILIFAIVAGVIALFLGVMWLRKPEVRGPREPKAPVSAGESLTTRAKAMRGDPDAQCKLGVACFIGEGVPKDTAAAVKWSRKAADQGHAEGQSMLGYAYFNGIGVPKDTTEAVKWFRKAADQGCADGQSMLGYAYFNGIGVPKDTTEAVKWFRKAAEQGDAGGELMLGIAYSHGDGVPKDYIQAHVWLNLAGANGQKEAKDFLATIEKAMTPEQKAKAMELARERR